MRKLLIILFCLGFAITGCNTARPATIQKDTIPSRTADSGGLTRREDTVLPPDTDNIPLKNREQNPSSPSLTNKDTAETSVDKLSSKRKTSFDHFNTLCSILAYDDFTAAAAQERFEAAWQEVGAMLSRVENTLSVNIPDSDIYNFNEARSGESVEVSPITAEIVAEAIEMYNYTGGAYNPAVANLVDLWGFSPRFLNREAKHMPYDRPRNENGSFDLPDSRYVEAFQALSDFSAVQLTRSGTGGYLLTKNAKDIEVDGVLYSLKIDLGGIAKGYAADKAAEIMRKNGYEYGFASIGLSSMKLLKRDVSDKEAKGDNMWSINISNPDDPSLRYMTGFGKDAGVSVSGTYDLRYFINGREYSHIIDPATGEPTASSIVSVSLWGGKASTDDALSTALCVMGREKATAFMNTYLKDYQVAFIAKTGGQLELVTNIPPEEYILYK